MCGCNDAGEIGLGPELVLSVSGFEPSPRTSILVFFRGFRVHPVRNRVRPVGGDRGSGEQTPGVADQEQENPDLVSPLVPLLQGWVLFAAVGQLMCLAGWPIRIVGEAPGWREGVLLSLVRLSVYGALAIGLSRREPLAWAGVCLELARGTAQFWLTISGADGDIVGSFYPAGWAQALMSAILPVLGGVSVALANGWTPGIRLEALASTAAYMTAGVSLLLAVRLYKHAGEFAIPPSARAVVLLRSGLPLVLFLLACERIAVVLSQAR